MTEPRGSRGTPADPHPSLRGRASHDRIAVGRPLAVVRIATAVGASAALGLAGLLGGAPASATTGFCVGGSGCYATVQAAVDAAPAGSTVHVGPGTFAGGVIIAKSLKLVGAGSAKTTLKGGDSVIQVNSPDGSAPPTVTISDLKLTGGVARGTADTPYAAFGGGLLVNGQGDSIGATVVLRNAVVAGNRVEASGTTTVEGYGYHCPDGLCPFAISAGGGVANFGTLTVDHSVIRDNRSTGRVSDADGAGIWTAEGRFTMLSSTVSGNVAEPERIGRFAEGAGLFAAPDDDNDLTPLVIKDSRFTGNSSILKTSWPVTPSADSDEVIGMQANAGGVHLEDGYAITVDRTSIDHNTVLADDPAGEAFAVDSGLLQGHIGTIAITRSTICHNSTRNIAAKADDVGPSGSAVEVDGTGSISDTVIDDNTADSVGAHGTAYNSGGLGVFSFDSAGVVALKRVDISGNTTTAESSTGQAGVFGGGILNNSVLTMTDSTVDHNRGTASSSGSVAEGGGIWNGVLLSGPPVSLAVHGSSIVGNALTAHDGTASGGGILSAGGDGVTFAIDHSLVRGNSPDQIVDRGADQATADAAPLVAGPLVTGPNATSAHGTFRARTHALPMRF